MKAGFGSLKPRVDFRCAVEQCPAKRFEECLFVVDDLGQPKVRQFEHVLGVIAGQQDVIWLNIAMSDALFVQVVKRINDLSSHFLAHELMHRHVDCRVLRQVAVLDVFHDDVDVQGCFVTFNVLDDVWLPNLLLNAFEVRTD